MLYVCFGSILEQNLISNYYILESKLIRILRDISLFLVSLSMQHAGDPYRLLLVCLDRIRKVYL